MSIGPRSANAGRLDPAHAQVLHFEKLLDAVLGPFAADARFLHAAERRDFVRDETGVDADHAGLEALAYAPDATHVARVEVARQAELGVVGHRDAFRFVLEAEQRRDRSEGLFFGDLHFRIDL